VKFGVSPFGIWRNKASDPLGSDTNGTQSYEANFADTRKWVKQEWIDYIVPQVYWNIGLAVADYAKLVPWWSDVVSGTRVQLYIGQADYKVGLAGQPAAWFDPAEMSRHLTFNEDYQVAGNVHFSAKDVKANRLGATDIYAADHYSRPALIPVMPQLPAKRLHPPTIVHLRRTPGGVSLSWLGKGATSYAIYRAECDASQLIATVRASGGAIQSYVDSSADPAQRYTYAVTALDRTWNESRPSVSACFGTGR
jgi:hypothetical protein